MITSRFLKWIAGIALISVLAAMLALAIPDGTVAAQSTTPPTPTPAAGTDSGKQVNTRLERLYVRANRILQRQTKILDKMDGLIGKAEDRIAKSKANGKDVSSLDAAFVAVKSAVSTARTTHDIAVATMSAHPGFDANGKVIDAVQARETMTSVMSGIRDERKDFGQAVKDFRQALRDFRKSHKAASNSNS